ncbi:lipoyltransferase [Pluteus cervinus]|uniref:Lipoyltransferase n=1 Tax=Pluteus cervinus TaxID=181527 RepID=A0ACD3BFR9_9AGAR|nr:lipoyltransferase [Pluteus cervinus]
MKLPPIFYHHFRRPLPYAQTLTLQEELHKLQLLHRRTGSHKDLLLLLEHRPVYTAGRRQTEDSVEDERNRLTKLGADFVTTNRGGELTYHGPGQIVGYPLLDLSRWSPIMGIRDYVCRVQKTIELHLKEGHGLDHVPSEHTGVFLSPTTKVGSIGIQVRHRLTNHGLAFNVTQEPIAWFDQVVACGLHDVRAGSIASATGKAQSVEADIPGLVQRFGRIFGREMVAVDGGVDEETLRLIRRAEEEAIALGNWPESPSQRE